MTAPAAADSPGVKGDVAIDEANIYLCTAANTWVKALLAFAWGYCTPLAGRMAAGLEALYQPLLPLLTRLPLVGQWAVLQRH